ncbi:MAG: NYN domain-containing protein [Holophagaceae bacterium]|nr:NYN domain-containing protein [Holophagaceae bacterium]
MTKKRVVAFIDGYNFYHSVHELNPIDPTTKQRVRTKDHLKWVNLWTLVEAFLVKSKEELVGVYYFSAYATWRPASYAKHRAFVAALKSVNVEVVMGQFKEKPRQCNNCKYKWKGHEEKETDVNLALYLLDLAYKDTFDKAVVLTADTDILPAIRMVQSQFPKKEIHGLLPASRYVAAHALKRLCPVSKFGEEHLERNLFPEQTLSQGTVIIQRPSAYDPPK